MCTVCGITIQREFPADVKYVAKGLLLVNLRQFSLFKWMFTVTGNEEHSIHTSPILVQRHISGDRGSLAVWENISSLIYPYPWRSVLDQETATGKLRLDTTVCSPLCCTCKCSALWCKPILKKEFVLKAHFKTELLISVHWIIFRHPWSCSLGSLALRCLVSEAWASEASWWKSSEMISDITTLISGH